MNNTLLAAKGSGGITNPALGPLGNLSGTDFFSRLIPAGVGIAFVIGVLYFFYMLITGSIQWISSGGDKQSLESARGTITNAIVGIIVLFATYAIIKVLETFFGISLLDLQLGNLAL